jgi:hypothetical protein
MALIKKIEKVKQRAGAVNRRNWQHARRAERGRARYGPSSVI